MSSIKRKQSLPVSTPADDSHSAGLRRRLSSLSLQIHPPAPSKSLSSARTSVVNWWTWAWAWILSSKPIVARDLEINDEEKHAIGFQNRASFMHVFFKAKSHLRRLFRFHDMSLPQTLSYDHHGSFKRAPIFG